MNLASINWLQKLFLLHSWTQIAWIAIAVSLPCVFGPIIAGDRRGKARHKIVWSAAGGFVVMMAIAILTFPGDPSLTADKLVHSQPVPIIKVTHVTGSKNYVAEDAHGKKYNINQAQVSIDTAYGQPYARLKHYVPNHDVTPEMIHAAKKQMQMPKDQLEINLSPTNAQTTQTWHFKK